MPVHESTPADEPVATPVQSSSAGVLSELEEKKNSESEKAEGGEKNTSGENTSQTETDVQQTVETADVPVAVVDANEAATLVAACAAHVADGSGVPEATGIPAPGAPGDEPTEKKNKLKQKRGVGPVASHSKDEQKPKRGCSGR